MSVYVKEPFMAAKACVIWMHGLGADANDMMGLVEQLSIEIPIRHVFMQAPKRPITIYHGMSVAAWYDILGDKITDREDLDGVQCSETEIVSVIESQLQRDLSAQQIYLAGFSQGAAMALFTGIRSRVALGGVVALSGYLPLVEQCKAVHEQGAVFMGIGRLDSVVLPDWTKASVDFLKKNHQNVVVHEYDIGHSVCQEELNDVSHWLTQQILMKEEIF